MYKYYDALLNRSGDALAGHFVRLFDAAGNQIDIFADESGTPIITESGTANAAKSDSDGMVRFFVASGDYDIRLYDASDTFIATERAVPMVRGLTDGDLSVPSMASGIGEVNEGNVQAALDAANTAIGERATTAALASTDPGKGASLIKAENGSDLQQIADNRGLVHLREEGGVGDGATDDNTSFEATRDAVKALHTANPLWSNSAIMTDDGKMTTYLPGGNSIFGVGRARFNGEIKLAAASDYLEVGLTSVLGEPTDYHISKVTTGYVRLTGIMNGTVRIDFAPKVEWWADSSVNYKKSNSYTYAFYGNVQEIVLNGIDGDGAGGASPYITSIRHFVKRGKKVTIKAGYPHNMHFFDCMGWDSGEISIEAGYSNYFEDCRFETTSTLAFSAGTHNNYAVNGYYLFRDSYFRRVAYGAHTVTDAGNCNELVEKLDAHYDQKELWSVHANSNNFNAALFTKNAADLTCVNNNQVIFDSGIFPLTNPLAIYAQVDASASSTFMTPFVYFYDATGALITADPGSGVISLLNGGWYTSGDPLGLNYHYRTSGAARSTCVSLFPIAGVAFARVVLRTGGSVNGTTFKTLRVVHTEAKKYNTRIPVLRPQRRDTCFSTAGTGATSVPCTAGTFTAGDYVENVATPGTAITEIGSTPKYVVTGWDRLTTGTGHVNNTDWRQRRAATGN